MTATLRLLPVAAAGLFIQLMSSTPALAWTWTFDATNQTPDLAIELHVVIAEEDEVLNAGTEEGLFTLWDSEPIGEGLVHIWLYGGSGVAPEQTCVATIFFEGWSCQSQELVALETYWTLLFPHGPIEDSFAPISLRTMWDSETYSGTFEAANHWRYIGSDPLPSTTRTEPDILVEDVFTTTTDMTFGIGELNPDLLYHPDLVWEEHDSFILTPEETRAIPIGTVLPGYRALLLCTTTGLNTGVPASWELWQICPGEVPTPVELWTWGRLKMFMR